MTPAAPVARVVPPWEKPTTITVNAPKATMPGFVAPRAKLDTSKPWNAQITPPINSRNLDLDDDIPF